MTPLTLLEMTQRILSSMDSDSVNSIDDTIESLQVADIIKECYEDLITQRDWPFLRQLTALTALADTTQPSTMRLPENMNKALWIRYDRKAVTYMPPEDFQAMIDGREEQADVVDADGIILNRDPLYWTSFDDDYIVFDSYDSTVESTLQASKAKVYGVVSPTWTVSDDFVPTLPAKMFPTLLADAKSTAFLQLKQQANAKEEAKARRGKARFQSEARRVDKAEHLTDGGIDYGRK
jgi:hypothetical protein